MRPAAPTPKPASAARRLRRPRPRGMVTVVVMLFLIATVVFALSQMLNVSSGNVIDGQRQGDSTAAFFLAESGLESSQASLSAALTGTVTETSCTGIAGTTNLGRGTVTVSGVSSPNPCSGSSCLGCALTAVGRVGLSTRTLTRTESYTTQNGVYCNGPVSHNCRNNTTPPTWQLTLTNTTAYDGIALFNLAYTAKGNNVATCPTGAGFLVCQVQFDLGSPSNGQNSAGIMGNTVTVPHGSATYPMYQLMDNADRSLVEVGVIFKGLTAAPTLTGRGGAGAASFWDNNGTNGSSAVTGQTNNGTASATGTGSACAQPTATTQTCADWCYGGDTLVMSYAAKVTSLADGLSAVTFNSTTGQSVGMQQLAKYATTLVPGAPVDVEAEIWVARNPNIPGGSPDVVNASSYKGRGTGGFGATWGGNDTSGMSGTTLTVGTNFSNYPSQIVSPGAVGVGDTISSAGGSAAANVNCSPSCPTILSQVSSAEPNGALGGRGIYTLSATQSVSAANNRVWTVSSNMLNLTGCTVCFFAANDGLNGLGSPRTISSQQTPLGTVATRGRIETTAGIGRYLTVGSPVAPIFQAFGSPARAGTPGVTIYVPSSSNLPAVTTPAMRLGVKTGTGAVAVNATVTSVSAVNSPNTVTRSFVLSAQPTTALDDVTLCGGTCAFFNGTGNTTFQITKSAGTAEWATAFTCLRGVTFTPQPVTSSTATARLWTETIY